MIQNCTHSFGSILLHALLNRVFGARPCVKLKGILAFEYLNCDRKSLLLQVLRPALILSQQCDQENRLVHKHKEKHIDRNRRTKHKKSFKFHISIYEVYFKRPPGNAAELHPCNASLVYKTRKPTKKAVWLSIPNEFMTRLTKDASSFIDLLLRQVPIACINGIPDRREEGLVIAAPGLGCEKDVFELLSARNLEGED